MYVPSFSWCRGHTFGLVSREIRIRDRFRKTFLKVKSVLTETKSEVWDNCGQTNCNRLEKIKQKQLV
jgi:hypothetical protein